MSSVESRHFLQPTQEKPAFRENIQGEPFVIRGHHLSSFILLQNGDFPYGDAYTPQELAWAQTQHFKEQLTAAKMSADQDPRDILYYEDLIGTNMFQRLRQTKASIQVYKKFITLPDDHPVELVSGLQDALCGACAIGEHCKTSGDKFGNDGLTRLTRDANEVRGFIRRAKRSGFEEGIEVTTRKTDYTDMDPVDSIAVATTAKVFKDVLRYYGKYRG
jgi:hypothetical protein